MQIISEIVIQKNPPKHFAIISGLKNNFIFYTNVADLQILI